MIFLTTPWSFKVFNPFNTLFSLTDNLKWSPFVPSLTPVLDKSEPSPPTLVTMKNAASEWFSIDVERPEVATMSAHGASFTSAWSPRPVEEYNALYFEMLFSCIYHGIYNDNMSVLKNLRGNDIQEDGMVMLKEDNGHTYRIKIPERLAKDLKQLSTINEWVRPNRFSLCHVEMKGVYSDSCFKVENRSTSSEDSYKFSYYSKLRKISKEYIGHSLLPLQLYASGIVHRIKDELDKNGITLEEAFAKNSRNRTAYMIIEKELIRSNSGIEISNFREMVKGHLSSFK